jgi:hypothetical protein
MCVGLWVNPGRTASTVDSQKGTWRDLLRCLRHPSTDGHSQGISARLFALTVLTLDLRAGGAMRNFVRSHKKTVSVVVLFILLFFLLKVWGLTAQIRGRFAARRDVARGQYVELSYGLPPEWLPEYARLLRARYGVELRSVAGCIVSEELIAYVNGYDEISADAVNRKFGRDVFKECEVNAQENWERRNASKTTRK